jgi:hypothetical protein
MASSKKTALLLLLLLFSLQGSRSQSKKYKAYTLAFYNVENLFDLDDDPEKKDEESPLMKLKNNREKAYLQKLQNIGQVIGEIGFEITRTSPALIGLAEIENRKVLEDLLNTKALRSKNYGIVHTDSPDARGIDVALLYQKSAFVPVHHQSHTLKIWSEEGHRIPTRNPLVVSGFLGDEWVHMIVNHWPSRRGGETKSRRLREKAASLNKHIADSIFQREPGAKIALLGDFNDDPNNSSLKKILNSQKSDQNLADTLFYNPFEMLFKKGYNTLGYRDNLHLFDQILLSGAWISKNKSFQQLSLFKSGIYNPEYLYLSQGRYKGYPYRSFVSGNFTGGYSDHFPVYVILLKKQPAS